MKNLELQPKIQMIRVQSCVENRKTKDFHDWFYGFIQEKIKEAI